MDNLTHALLGAGLVGIANPPQKYRRGVWLAVLLGSEVPDLDLLPSLFSSQAQVALHRGDSHSLLGLCVIAGLVTLTVGVLEPRLPRTQALVWVCSAVLVHICFDALNSYGTKILYPFAAQPVALDILYSIDLVILVILGLGSLFYYRGNKKALAVAMLLVTIYTGGRGLIHADLVAAISKEFPAMQFSVVPSFNPAGSWVFIVDKGDKYEVGKIKPISQRVWAKAEIHKNLSQPLVARIRNNATVDSYLAVARYPVAEIAPLAEGWKVKLIDLRLWPYLTFNALVKLNKQGNIINIKVGPLN